MPVLKDFRNTKVIKLTAYEGAEVTIYDSLLVKDLLEIETIEKGNFTKLLSKLIKCWNFTDESGQVLPINDETIGLLDAKSLGELAAATKELSEETKKG